MNRAINFVNHISVRTQNGQEQFPCSTSAQTFLRSTKQLNAARWLLPGAKWS